MSQARSRAELVRELSRFLVVGFGAVGVDFVVYFGLLWAQPSLNPSLAKAISFIAGGCWSFLLNRRFVFQSEGTMRRQALPFTLLYLFGLGLNNAINWVALAQGAPKWLAWFLATAASTVSNFLGMKLVVFRRTKTP